MLQVEPPNFNECCIFHVNIHFYNHQAAKAPKPSTVDGILMLLAPPVNATRLELKVPLALATPPILEVLVCVASPATSALADTLLPLDAAPSTKVLVLSAPTVLVPVTTLPLIVAVYPTSIWVAYPTISVPPTALP
jgi:hypothetical protein